MRHVVIMASVAATLLILCGCGDSTVNTAPPLNPDEPRLEWEFDPKESVSQAVKVDRVVTSIAEKTALGWWYEYEFNVRNGSRFTIEVDVSILWLGAGDQEVHHTELRKLQIGPLASRNIRRFAFIPLEDAGRIVRPNMIWTWRTLF